MKKYIRTSVNRRLEHRRDADERIAYGKQLYDAYGPNVDAYDLDEYDAECYLAYKRSIGE